MTHAKLILQVLFFQRREQPLLLPCLKITYARSLVILGSYDTDSLIKTCLALTFSPVAVGSSGLGFKHSLSLSFAKFCFDSASNYNTYIAFLCVLISLIVTVKQITGHYLLTTTLERITNK